MCHPNGFSLLFWLSYKIISGGLAFLNPDEMWWCFKFPIIKSNLYFFLQLYLLSGRVQEPIYFAWVGISNSWHSKNSVKKQKKTCINLPSSHSTVLRRYTTFDRSISPKSYQKELRHCCLCTFMGGVGLAYNSAIFDQEIYPKLYFLEFLYFLLKLGKAFFS